MGRAGSSPICCWIISTQDYFISYYIILKTLIIIPFRSGLFHLEAKFYSFKAKFSSICDFTFWSILPSDLRSDHFYNPPIPQLIVSIRLEFSPRLTFPFGPFPAPKSPCSDLPRARARLLEHLSLWLRCSSRASKVLLSVAGLVIRRRGIENKSLPDCVRRFVFNPPPTSFERSCCKASFLGFAALPPPSAYESLSGCYF